MESIYFLDIAGVVRRHRVKTHGVFGIFFHHGVFSAGGKGGRGENKEECASRESISSPWVRTSSKYIQPHACLDLALGCDLAPAPMDTLPNPEAGQGRFPGKDTIGKDSAGLSWPECGEVEGRGDMPTFHSLLHPVLLTRSSHVPSRRLAFCQRCSDFDFRTIWIRTRSCLSVNYQAAKGSK